MLELDRYYIQSIKSKLGTEIVKNLEAMINDIQIWYDNRADFKEYLNKNWKEVVCGLKLGEDSIMSSIRAFNKDIEDPKMILNIEPTIIGDENENIDVKIENNTNIINEKENKDEHALDGEIKNINFELEDKYLNEVKHPNLNINVLAHCELKIPTDIQIVPSFYIQSIQVTFEKYYREQKYNLKKRLLWIYYYGSMEIKYSFDKTKSYFLVVKPYQFFILDLFNINNLHSEGIKYSKI